MAVRQPAPSENRGDRAPRALRAYLDADRGAPSRGEQGPEGTIVQQPSVPVANRCRPNFPPAAVSPDDLAAWAPPAGLCRVSLGFNAFLGLDLTAQIDPFFDDASLSGDEALSVLLPAWYASYRLARSSYAPRIDATPWSVVPGLFWTDRSGYYERVVAMAARTVYAFAADVVSLPVVAGLCYGTTPAGGAGKVRRRLEGTDFLLSTTGQCGPLDTASLSLDAAGVLSVAKKRGDSANGDARISLCDQWRVDCAIVDYYFRAAKRLLAWARAGHEPVWHAYLAVLCAKAALAQIVEIGGEIVHELGHKLRGPHCVIEGEVGSCCQFFGDQMYKAKMRARLGLPKALFADRLDTSSLQVDGRFQVNLLAPWMDDVSNSCGTPDEGGLVVKARFTSPHCALLAPHQFAIRWQAPPNCSSETYGTEGTYAADPSGMGLACCIPSVDLT